MKRLYFIEVFALLNLVAIVLVTREYAFIRPSPWLVVGLIATLGTQALAGIAIRAFLDLVRRRRGYLRRIRRRQWMVEALRQVIAISLVFYAYGWIKVAVPLVHRRLFDQALWDLDQLLMLGIEPTVFLLSLFGGSKPFLKLIDWSYANIFWASLTVSSAYFLSHPARRIRTAFVSGNALLWIAGAWLYMLVPSLGPAYRFPDLWFAYEHVLERTQGIQALLMRNYQDVLRAARGEPHGPIRVMFAIAAFPSLHVAFQAYVFLWMRRLWTSGEVLFGVFAATIFLGSMITGWHYMVDGLAGLVIALVCWLIFWRRARMARFLRLF